MTASKAPTTDDYHLFYTCGLWIEGLMFGWQAAGHDFASRTEFHVGGIISGRNSLIHAEFLMVRSKMMIRMIRDGMMNGWGCLHFPTYFEFPNGVNSKTMYSFLTKTNQSMTNLPNRVILGIIHKFHRSKENSSGILCNRNEADSNRLGPTFAIAGPLWLGNNFQQSYSLNPIAVSIFLIKHIIGRHRA